MNALAKALRNAMSDISEDVYAAGWMSDCEWSLWAALTDWRDGKPAVWSFADITAHMPDLDELSRVAGGWIWWLEPDGEQFVPEERWLRLAAERQRDCISNERLNLRILA